MSESSWFKTAFGLLIAVLFILGVFAPWAIPIVINVFVFLFVDHVEGMVVGAILVGIIGRRLEDGIVGAIAGVILQYLLFQSGSLG